MVYLLTFGCYGHWLHGDERGSVDRSRNRYGTRIDGRQPALLHNQRRLMKCGPFEMGSLQRRAVMDAVLEACEYRGWDLMAGHVRTTHVHLVVRGEAAPEAMLVTFKAYATRRLNLIDGKGEAPPWARHGSTRYLWTAQSVAAACRYVLDGQGQVMETYCAQELG